jgi:hypothetical protein
MCVELGSSATQRTSQAVASWIDFQTDGIVNFDASLLHQGALLPMEFGPGALAAKLLQTIHGDRAPDVEAMIVGMDVAHAMALSAACAPIPDPRLYPLYELTSLMTGARATVGDDSPLKSFPVVAELDRILQSLAIPIVTTMPVTDWVELTREPMLQLRDALCSAFRSVDVASLEAVQDRAVKLEWELANLAANHAKLARNVDRFELLGLAADSVAWLTDTTFPFAGTMIGVAIKKGAPHLWRMLEASPHTAEARDVLASIGGRVSPSIVRLHRLSGELVGATRAG